MADPQNSQGAPVPDGVTLGDPVPQGISLGAPVPDGVTLGAPPPPKSALERAGDTVNSIADRLGDFGGPQTSMKIASGAVKGAEKGVGGLLNLIDKYVIDPNGAAATPARQTAHRYAKATADWINKNTDTEGWEKAGDIGEQVYELATLKKAITAAPEAIAEASPAIAKGASTVMSYGDHVMDMAKNAKLLEGNEPIAHLVRLGRVASKAIAAATGTAAEQGAQTFVHTGGDTEQAKQAAAYTGLLHLGAGLSLGPLGDWLEKLKQEAADAIEGAKPTPPPDVIPQEPRPQASAPEPITPAERPTPPEPAPRPAPRVPAVERFAAHEQDAARGMTAEQLEDLNKYRQVDERGTPTNIQQLGLPSQSATEPYQFRVPGWSATTEAGDLLHEAGARYKQTGTRVVEGKGSGNMQPWEMQQNPPFDLPRYAETPGATVQTEPPTAPQAPETPPPPRESSPLWAQRGPDEPPTSPFSHKEAVMTATQYQTGVRPGSQIRQATTVGGPSILTTDPQVAAGHLSNIENIIQDSNFSKLPPARQMDILQSHNEVMRQMQEYQNLQGQHDYSPYLHQPTFPPADIDSALARTNDMGDAAKEMMRGPKEMYNQWQELTKNRPGGSFKELNDIVNDQGKTPQQHAIAHQELAKMFNGSDPYLGRAGTPTDLAIARAHFNNGYLVQRADDAFTNAYKGAARTGDFDVSKLQSNWKALVNDVGEARMSNTLGPDRYQSMNNVINDLAGEPAIDKAANAAANAADQAASQAHSAALSAANDLDKAATTEAKAAAKEKYQNALSEWRDREADRVKTNQAAKDNYTQQEAARKAATTKQKWYFNLARNGWHQLATGAGLEAVANIMPHGMLGSVSAKVGAALILKQIITHPLMAKLAYGGAQLGTHPEILGPVIAEIIKSQHANPAPTKLDTSEPQPADQLDQLQLQEQP